MRNISVLFKKKLITSNLSSPVLLDKSRNSNCKVVTSEVELSGDHFGE